MLLSADCAVFETAYFSKPEGSMIDKSRESQNDSVKISGCKRGNMAGGGRMGKRMKCGLRGENVI
jgi:hypothetical protein